jgi:hypothetical protein
MSMKTNPCRVPGNALACALLFLSFGFAAEPKIPDFTKGEKLVQQGKEKLRSRMLGPTGLWVDYHSQGMEHGATRLTRQFLVSKVEPGSPADGKIKPGDVILGVDGKPFADDARKVLAAAIEKAEGGKGSLSLHVWREGKVSDPSIQLKAFGVAHASTCPHSCSKCDALIPVLAEQTKKAALPPKMREKDQGTLMFPSMYALGMLASGQDDLMPDVKAYAHSLCVDSKTGNPFQFVVSDEGRRVWHTGYNLIFLSEYYMATKDEFVLPTIKELAVGASQGQSGVGSYGHRFSSRNPDGSFHGPLVGYGAINNAGLTMHLGIILANKCGVEHEEITRAIKMGKRFFDFYVEHGTIPYGDHWPSYEWLDDNGKNAQAAIMYELLGDDRGQRFFSTITVASGPTGCEEGHQGSYWSHLWGGLGAVRSGEKGAQAFFREVSHIRTLERSWTGQVLDPGSIGMGRHSSMTRGDVTGERLLFHSLGRKKLHLTGKELKVKNPLTGKELDNAIEGGRLLYNPELRKSMSEATIFDFLANELTPLRFMAARELQQRKLDRVDPLIAMLDSDNRYARYGACNGLAMAGFQSPKAVEAVRKRLEKDEDILFRYFAVDALASRNKPWGQNEEFGLNAAAGPAVPLLLKLASQPVPNDPRQQLHWWIAEALFDKRKDLFTHYAPSGKVDDALLVSAVEKILNNENGRARSMVAFGKLTESQLEPLWETVLNCVRTGAPSGIMFSFGVRTDGLSALAKHRIKEGLDLCMDLAVEERDKSTGWVPWHAVTMLEVLPNYGKDAEPVVKVIESWPILKGRGAAELVAKLQDLKKKMEVSEKLPLKSIGK